MAYGAVPVAGAISSIPQILEDTGAGVSFDPLDEARFVDAIEDFVRNPDRWAELKERGLASASQFTFQSYLQRVVSVFREHWGVSLDSVRPA
jgi:glycosyltransferase involved in cell wall biosynthesis